MSDRGLPFTPPPYAFSLRSDWGIFQTTFFFYYLGQNFWNIYSIFKTFWEILIQISSVFFWKFLKKCTYYKYEANFQHNKFWKILNKFHLFFIWSIYTFSKISWFFCFSKIFHFLPTFYAFSRISSIFFWILKYFQNLYLILESLYLSDLCSKMKSHLTADLCHFWGSLLLPLP